MVSTEASRAEAFASQADRSRDQAAGYLQQTIATAKSVMIAKAQIGQWLASISVPFRWAGTRLDLQGPDGQWVAGPDLAGLGITAAEIVGGHLLFTFSSGTVSDLGQVVPDGDFVGPSSSVDGEIVLFDGVTGKRGKGSGKTISSFAPAVHTHPVANLSDASSLARQLLQAADAPSMRALLQLVKGAGAGNIPVLDVSGKLDTSILPALALTDTFEVASQVAMLALTAQQGDIAIRTDLNKTFVLSSNAPGTLADWKELRTPTDLVQAVAGLTGTITAPALRSALNLVVGTDVQAFNALIAAIAALTPTNGNVITGNGITWVSQPPVTPTLIVRDEKTSGTSGGASPSGAWAVRALNTVAMNTITGASLVSNQITLPAGTYEVDASCPAYAAYGHKTRLRTTGGVTLVDGTSERTEPGAFTITGRSIVRGGFTLAASTVVQLEHYFNSTNGMGLGYNASISGVPEIYSVAVFKKVG